MVTTRAEAPHALQAVVPAHRAWPCLPRFGLASVVRPLCIGLDNSMPISGHFNNIPRLPHLRLSGPLQPETSSSSLGGPLVLAAALPLSQWRSRVDPVRRAGKHKTLYAIIRKVGRGRGSMIDRHKPIEPLANHHR